MSVFCVPKHLLEKLKNSALKGEVDIVKLYNMSSKDRRAFFTKYTDEQLGRFLNVEFEKAKASQRADAFQEWAKSAFDPQEKKKPVYKNVLDKIKNLDEMGILDPKAEAEYMEDLVADKLGVSVTPEEVAKISNLAKELQAKQEVIGDNIGSPDHWKETEDFFVAKKKIDDYLQEINPQHKLKILTGTVGRASMLASIKSPIMNIESNTVTGVLEALRRRVGGVRGTDNKLALDYWKNAQRIYQRTGYDISRMMDINDTGVSGQRVLGGDMVHAKGKGLIRKAGQIAEDVVFKQMMGAPDVAFSAAHFADSVNLNARKVFGNTLKAKEVMKDAMRIKPLTSEGELLRAEAILDAEFATYTNKGWASKLSLGIRNLLNEATGDIRAGDYLMPFVKTPAEVVSLGIEYGGGTLPKDLYTVVKEFRKGDLQDRAKMNTAMAGLVRAGLGLTTAAILAYNTSEDDFVGEYDPKRAQIEGLRGSGDNMFRAGGKWYSTDYLGVLAVPFTAMMFAKKYGQGNTDKMYQYAKGVYSQVSNLPGLDLAKKTYQGYQTAKVKSAGEAAKEEAGLTLDELRSRLIPSVVSDIAKSTDTYAREAKGPLEKLQSTIPVWRQGLNIKYDIFGEPVKNENPFFTLVAGSRVKTSKEDAVVTELNNLYKSDNQVALVDFSKTARKKIAQLRNNISPEDFNNIKIEYGKTLKSKLSDLFESDKYQNSDETDKEKLVRSAMEEVISQYTNTNR